AWWISIYLFLFLFACNEPNLLSRQWRHFHLSSSHGYAGVRMAVRHCRNCTTVLLSTICLM
ncbi:hypothetical protein TSAR_013273, partial [Trichomalopsis sarcophagae]